MPPKRSKVEEPPTTARSSRRGSVLPMADVDNAVKKKQAKSNDSKIKKIVDKEEGQKNKVSKRIASRSREEIEEVVGRGRRNTSGKKMDEEKKVGKKVKEEVEVEIINGRKGSKKIREVEEEQKGKKKQQVKEEEEIVVVEKKSNKNKKDQESKSVKQDQKNESQILKKPTRSKGISIDTTPEKVEKKNKKSLQGINVEQEETGIKVKSKGSKKEIIEEIISKKETTKESRKPRKRNTEEEEEEEQEIPVKKQQNKSVEMKQKTNKSKIQEDNIIETKLTNKSKKNENKQSDKTNNKQNNSAAQDTDKQKENKLLENTTASSTITDNLSKQSLPTKPKKRKIEIVISNEIENELSTKPQKKRKEFVAADQKEFKEVIFLNPDLIKKQEQAFEEAMKNQKLEILGKVEAAQNKKQYKKKTKKQLKAEEQVDEQQDNENSMVIDISVSGNEGKEGDIEKEESNEEKQEIKKEKNTIRQTVVPFKKGLDLDLFFAKKQKDIKIDSQGSKIHNDDNNSNTQIDQSQPDTQQQPNDQVEQEVKPKSKRGRKKKSDLINAALSDRRMQSENDKQSKYIDNAQPDSSEDENGDETKANTQQLTVNSKSKYFRINSKGRVKKQPKNQGQLDENGLLSKLNIEAIRTDFDEAMETLQEYSLPSEIPCREAEKKEILDFLTEGLDNNGSSNCLYISGVPGIGKTASFLEVVSKLQKDRSDDFQFINVNAMKLSNPESLYNVLTKEIAQINPSSKNQACLILNELFTRGKLPKKYQDKYEGQLKKQNIIILLDELDYLVTSDQEVLYNLMEWPHHRESRLTIVGIANTMNLPEQLMQKIKSRMGSRRLVFNQYSHKQIQTIVRARLETVSTVFESTAVDFACRKIAISSSDIRKTLKVLRKAVEICQKESTNLVKIQHIQEAYTLLYSSPSLNAIKKLGFHHKLLVLSLALENKHRGLPIAYMSESFERYKVMANNLGSATILGSSAINLILSQLCSFGLFSVKEKTHCTKEGQQSLDPNKKKHTNVLDALVTSNFTVDDITNSLREDEIYLKFQFQF